MLNIPAALFTKYSLLLNKKSVPVSVQNNYKKWLRRARVRSIFLTLPPYPHDAAYRSKMQSKNAQLGAGLLSCYLTVSLMVLNS